NMPTTSSIRIDRGISVAMRDGTVLFADVYRPADERKYPVLLQRTPYNRQLYTHAPAAIDTLRAVARGYAVIIQDVRGRYDSEGTFNPFHQEIDDGYDTVEWCAAQPWSDGKVGMYGGSYVGAVQWLAAIARPPHLKCIVPMFTASDYYEGWTYQGGALQWGFLTSWGLPYLASEGLFRRKDDQSNFCELRQRLAGLIDNMRETFRTLPLRSLPLVAEFAPYILDWLDHPTRDEFWRAVSIEDRHGMLGIPALNLGGWFDIFLGGTLRNFSGLRRGAATDEARQGARLLVGPWVHVAHGSNMSGTADFGIGSSDNNTPLRTDINGEILRFCDRWLKGIDGGFDAEPPVKIFVMGENVWRTENEWPPARTRYTSFYLHSGGDANSIQGNGQLSTEMPGSERPDVFLYDPNHPVPTNGGQMCCYGPALPAGVFDQTEIEKRRDVLVYRTPPLEQALEVTVPVIVELWASTSAPDTDFTAKLVDLCPCGCSTNLTDGIIRARYRAGTDKPVPITPGETYSYRIDLWSTSNLFLRGHRIGVEVSSSNFPRFDRNTNTGGVLGDEVDLMPAVQTIFHDAEHPSQLILPVIPRAVTAPTL
ncbi:MAG TPA: CocE/NonD family hydrolase, partial [Chloroflexota bacterium]|nr:CocE/NonD family hydrolase [Chloroflexota bacterium]